MNVYIKVINLKWHDIFRPLLCHHQVSVNVKVLNLYTIWIHIMGCLYTTQYHTCKKTLRVMYYLKCNWLRLDEPLCIQLNVKLKLKLKRQYNVWSRDSSVGIASGYGLVDRGVGVRVPVGSKIFSSPRSPDRLRGQPSILSNAYRG
jgi:hypothetical protein